MPVITSIKPQKNGKRVNIYLDSKFGFGLDIENFVKLGLKVEQELSLEEIEKVIKKAEFQKISDRLIRFAMVRPRSEKEIHLWMRRKKVNESLQDDLFNKLKRFDLIDDEKFAKWWVDQRQHFRPKPKRMLTNELRIKGISKNIIEDVLEGTEVDEEKIAKDLIIKNLYKWEKLDKFKARQKMTAYLARKGFGWDIIRKVVEANLID